MNQEPGNGDVFDFPIFEEPELGRKSTIRSSTNHKALAQSPISKRNSENLRMFQVQNGRRYVITAK